VPLDVPPTPKGSDAHEEARGAPGEPPPSALPSPASPSVGAERSSDLPRTFVRLEARGVGIPPLVFKQGAHPPFGIRWYGITSLFGHLRGFVSRFIAAESVDSRDWMKPDAPSELLRATVARLTAHNGQAPELGDTLVETLGRPLWIDFVADTGDDRDVSRAVGVMLAADYLLPTPSTASSNGRSVFDERSLPRGELLLMGGDVAYPVATADEIHERLVMPWNEAFRAARGSGTPRVLLGVPGNHDWYDGLDGFGRLFRKRVEERFIADDREKTTRLERRLRKTKGRKVGLVARQLHLDEVSGLVSVTLGALETLRRVFTGRTAKKRRHLTLRGYAPLQEASFFALPLAPGLDLFGIDRQLGQLDFRQRAFFKKRRKERPENAVFVLSADPAVVYGERNDPGAQALAMIRLSLERNRIFFISGDFHHYERRTIGRSCHVIAGGGGAFLHGTRIDRAPMGEPEAAYPDARTSRELALGAPVKLMLGRAGLLVHVAMALVATLALFVARTYASAPMARHCAQASMAVGTMMALYFIAHAGPKRRPIFLLSIPFGAALGLMPFALLSGLPHVLQGGYAGHGAVTFASAVLGSLVFGLYLTVLALLGLEHQQAFTILGHPGFKHFVRLCVHPDGRIEGFVIGKDDMLTEGPPKLVDRFEWTPRPSPSPGRPVQLSTPDVE
jgi:hypothetical protein